MTPTNLENAERAEMSAFSPPFSYVPVPLDADGQGPADDVDAASVAHDVWDANCVTVATCGNEEAARSVAALMNAGVEARIRTERAEMVKPSIDTMREAAWELLRKNGWDATARLSLHQVAGLMAQFGMNVSAGEVGCGYPDCGCCADAACDDAINQHPDFRADKATAGEVEDGPFHVSRSSDGERNWFSARDAASGVTIPLDTRERAQALVSSLNRAFALHLRMAALTKEPTNE